MDNYYVDLKTGKHGRTEDVRLVEDIDYVTDGMPDREVMRYAETYGTKLEDVLAGAVDECMYDHVCEDSRIVDADTFLPDMVSAVFELLDVFDVTGGNVCSLCGNTAQHSHSCAVWRLHEVTYGFIGTDLYADIR